MLPLRRVFEVDKHRFDLLSAEMCRKILVDMQRLTGHRKLTRY